MTSVTKLLAGAAAVAALAGAASPASAQYYGYPYGSNPYGYGYPGYGSPYGYGAPVPGVPGSPYSANEQMSLDRCAAAVGQRLNAGYSAYAYGGGYGYGGGRLVGVHSIQRIPSGISIRGVATDGRVNPYAAYGAANMPNLRFRCDVDFRGYVMDVSLAPNTDYRYNWTPYTRPY